MTRGTSMLAARDVHWPCTSLRSTPSSVAGAFVDSYAVPMCRVSENESVCASARQRATTGRRRRRGATAHRQTRVRTDAPKNSVVSALCSGAQVVRGPVSVRCAGRLCWSHNSSRYEYTTADFSRLTDQPATNNLNVKNLFYTVLDQLASK